MIVTAIGDGDATIADTDYGDDDDKPDDDNDPLFGIATTLAAASCWR